MSVADYVSHLRQSYWDLGVLIDGAPSDRSWLSESTISRFHQYSHLPKIASQSTQDLGFLCEFIHIFVELTLHYVNRCISHNGYRCCVVNGGCQLVRVTPLFGK